MKTPLKAFLSATLALALLPACASVPTAETTHTGSTGTITEENYWNGTPTLEYFEDLVFPG